MEAMSVRESIMQNPRWGIAAAGALLLIGVVVIVLQLSGHSLPAAPGQAYFSTDDGKTWFADDATRIPPFDKDGKQAVRAHVYRAPDGTKFVNYIERFKPDARKALENSNNPDTAQKARAKLGAVQNAYTGGRQVKRPGDAEWIDMSNFRKAADITSIKCPNGATTATEVDP